MFTIVFWIGCKAKKKELLFPEMQVKRKIFNRATANLFFSTKLTEFFK